MANTLPASFGDLLSSAWASVKERMNVLFPGVIIFTVIMVLTQIPLAAFEDETVTPTNEQIGIAIIAAIVSALVSVISYLYYLIAVTGKDQSVGTILGKTFPRIFPFIGLMILVMLRTFTWISLVGGLVLAYGAATQNLALVPIASILVFVGIICGIVLGPRYMLAPVIWIMEGGVNASIKKSFEVSKGYWGKILGNTLLLALIFMIIMVGVGIVAGIARGMGAGVGAIIAGLLTTFFSQFYNVVLIAFLLKLAATIIANPRSGVVAAPVKASVAAPAVPKPVKAAAPAVSASKVPVKKAPVKKKTAPKKSVKKK